MHTFLILRRQGWATAQDLEKAAGVSSRVGNYEMSDRVRWIRSYVIREDRGRLGTVCIYQGIDAAAVLEHAQRAGLPCDEIIPVSDTVVINEDPVPAGDAPAPEPGSHANPSAKVPHVLSTPGFF
jgi:hypothetical protein